MMINTTILRTIATKLIFVATTATKPQQKNIEHTFG